MDIKVSQFQKLLVSMGVDEAAAAKVKTERTIKSKIKGFQKNKEKILENEGDVLNKKQLTAIEKMVTASPSDLNIINDLEESKSDAKSDAKSDDGKKPAKEGGIKKVGVIFTIFEEIQKHKSKSKGVTKEELLDVLCSAFPERPRDSMAKTVNVQVPTRMNGERFKDKEVSIKSEKVEVKEGDKAVKKTVYWVEKD